MLQCIIYRKILCRRFWGALEKLMNPCQLTMMISAIACCIAEEKSADEIGLMGSIFSQLGDTLATIAAQQALCSPEND